MIATNRGFFALILIGIVGCIGFRDAGSVEAAGTAGITVLSSRAEMVSGGDALVSVTLPDGQSSARVMLNGATDVTTAFKPAGTGRLVGLVTGLRQGENTLRVTSGSGTPVSAVLTNYPSAGPIISGPHEQPYHCMTQSFALPASKETLGPALDANCTVRTRVDYIYKNTAGTFVPLPAGARPADLAQTTTSLGKRVPYIVRVETGTINRAIYQTGVLSDPSSEPAPGYTAPPSAWNQRLIYTFGGGCVGGWFMQGNRIGDDGIIEDAFLARGYAVASASLNVFGFNCNPVLATETSMMVKERLIETYGAPLLTIGYGCSGGSEQLHPLTDGYPGIIDGAIVACSFPELMSGMILNQTDADLWGHYLSTTSMKWTEAEEITVTGYPNHQSVAAVAEGAIRTKAQNGDCNEVVPLSTRFDRQTNPKGVRCDVYEHNVNIVGRDPATGFARRPLDNVGVQYGVNALNAGRISVAQFLDVNRKIGGYDKDGVFQAARTVADLTALGTLYRTGQITYGGNGLKTTPIVDYRSYADIPANNHQSFHSYSLRARLDQVNGNHANHVMLVEKQGEGRFDDLNPIVMTAITQLDQWLTTLAGSGTLGTATPAQVASAKPAELVDACFTDKGATKITEAQVYRGDTRCNKLYFPHSTPRMEAGGPLANNILKCQLKPVSRADYKVTFTPAEWNELTTIFQGGVCDWSKPGVGQVPSQTWARFK